MNRWKTCLNSGLILALSQFGSSIAEENQRPSLLIVGSAHFQNFGRDQVNLDIEDITTPIRQKEIESFVNHLEAYKPTHIAVEIPATAQALADHTYNGYVVGEIELRATEAHQLGYRLGKRLGHTRIYAIDWNDNPPGDPDDYDWFTFGQSNGFQETINAISDSSNLPNVNDMTDQTISEWLMRINSQDVLRELHKFYFDIATISDEVNQPGPNWVGSWYGRNLKMFNNILNISSDPADRILVIVGLGHAYLLNQFATESGYFDTVRIGELSR